MKADDLVPLLITGTFLVMLVTERIRPARGFPRMRAWTWIGFGFFLLIMTLNAVLPSLLPLEWIAQHSLLPGYQLGTVGGILVGYPAVSLATALAHRCYHRFNPLWRWVHQLHHAPIRVDMPGSVQFHPLDITLNILVSLLVTVAVLGLSPDAAAWTGYVAVFYGLFQHWNIRTPRWLGFLIQRPESHSIHHQRDVHSFNFSDFPLWDILMGSFRNPASWSGEAGFGEGAHLRYGAMLLGRDVNPTLVNGAAPTEEPAAPATIGRPAHA
jgi:sterol desaturase/sphingolipid hydroxylase (fatty acid hydroxylase superfamily)